MRLIRTLRQAHAYRRRLVRMTEQADLRHDYELLGELEDELTTLDQFIAYELRCGASSDDDAFEPYEGRF